MEKLHKLKEKDSKRFLKFLSCFEKSCFVYIAHVLGNLPKPIINTDSITIILDVIFSIVISHYNIKFILFKNALTNLEW